MARKTTLKCTKSSLNLLLFLLCFWALARFTHHETSGFRLTKLEGNSSPLPSQLPPSLAAEEKRAIDALFSAPFTYLGRGKQSFAFLSEDGTTVLKLFIPNERKEKLKATFESYQLAFDLLKEESGLLYFHPQEGEDKFPSVTLIDRLAIAHPLDLNSKGFLLQRRAILTYDYLSTKTEEEATAAIYALIALLRSKMDKGIADSDPLLRANVGFVGNCPIQIDLGPLKKDQTLRSKEKQREVLVSATLALKHWLEKNRPELVKVLGDAIEP